jgi:hypothetical protein
MRKTKMKTTKLKPVNKEEMDLEEITFKPTPNLDVVQNKVNKLLKATAASYISEACEALRKDWNPTMSDDVFRLPENLGLQKAYREKIIDTFVLDSLHPDGVWNESIFKLFWPKWLRNPIQEESTIPNREKAAQAILEKKVSKFQQQVQQQAKTFDKITEKLPEPPKILEPKEEEPGITTTPEEPTGSDEPFDDAERKQFTIQMYEDNLSKGEIYLWQGLTNKKTWPKEDDDLINDYIKPTREFRSGLFHELNQQSDKISKMGVNYHYRHLQQLKAVIDDALNIIEKVQQ